MIKTSINAAPNDTLKFVYCCRLATGIFHDLYDDIITIASRGKDLKARVACLEADLSLVEKALHAEASQCRFAYTASIMHITYF